MVDTPLLTAVVNRDVGAALELLHAAANGGVAVDLNLVDNEYGSPALVWAAGHGDVEVVTALLAAPGKDGVAVDLNLADKDGQTVLMWAASNGNIAVITALLAAPGKDGVAVDLNAAGKAGNTALIVAANRGNTEIVTALLAAPGKDGVAVDLNLADKKGSTALISAAANGHVEIVAALLDAKDKHARIATAADVSAIADDGHTAHHYASTKHPAKFTPELLSRLSGDYGKLVAAIKDGDVAAVRAVLAAAAGPAILNTADANNDTVLMVAVQSASMPMLNALLEAGGQSILDAAVTLATSAGKSDILSSLRLLRAPAGGGASSTNGGDGAAAAGGGGRAAVATADADAAHRCPTWKRAKAVVDSWGLPSSLFKPDYDMCYCGQCGCHDASLESATRGTPPKTYAFPIGWCRFALNLPAGENTKLLAKKHVSFHGTRLDSARAILDASNPQLLMPGSTTEKGFKLPIRPGHIAGPFERTNEFTKKREMFNPNQIFTSPTIKVSALHLFQVDLPGACPRGLK